MTTYPTLRLWNIGAATSYHFRDPGCGWAICTVNAATGELQIMSDWGDWAHRWDPRGAGPLGWVSLIAHANVEYLGEKLTYGGTPTDSKRWEFDEDATIAEFRGEIIEDRQSHRPQLTKDEARELWDELERLDNDNAEAFVRGWMELHGSDFIERPWDMTAKRHRGMHKILLTSILPALQVQLRAALAAARCDCGMC